MNITNIFDQFQNKKIMVLGDVMLDTYWIGNVDRISPEGPVPIVSITHTETRVGGAGNVAINLAALGAQVEIVSCFGNDEAGENLKNLFKTNGVSFNYIIQNSRPTTNKIRIIGRNQQMMRLDKEITNDLNKEEEDLVFKNIENCISAYKPDVLIFEDYNKGVLTANLIKSTLNLAKKNNIITAVDPKIKNFFEYQGVTIFKPNLKEIKTSFNINTEQALDEDVLKEYHQKLSEKLNHKYSVITLAEKGIFSSDGNKNYWVKAHKRNIADVSGAGDTVIATLSLVYCCTNDILLATQIANIAGGLVCEIVGTATISREKLLDEVLQKINQ